MGSRLSTAVPKEVVEPPAIRRHDAEAEAEEDLISDLPDELLHSILVRLPSAAAAARTSVLSRRWRGVWARMPELVLSPAPSPSTTPPPPPSAPVDSIDAALSSYAAPTLRSLKIAVTGIDRRDVPADRIAPWLRFASERVDGKLCLSLSVKKAAVVGGHPEDVNEELALPICERATEIDLELIGNLTGLVLRPPPPTASSFLALTDLKIYCSKVDGGDLGRLVSSPQCPRLRRLRVFVTSLTPVCDVSICSESLVCLDYNAFNTGKLEVNAPMLQAISVNRAARACIVAPKLENVKWTDKFVPGIHQFAAAGRHLQSLRIVHSSFLGVLISSTQLMMRYDTVKELKFSLGLLKASKQDLSENPLYVLAFEAIASPSLRELCDSSSSRKNVTFMKEFDKLPMCESLDICLTVNHHSLPAIMLHVLRRCSCIRKLELTFFAPLSVLNPPKVTPCSILGCPCLLPENCKLDDIAFDSLEEIGINFFTGSDEQEEFMKLLLSKCNMVTLKTVDISLPSDPAVYSEIMEVVERIRSVCHTNTNVQFNVTTREVPKPFAS